MTNKIAQIALFLALLLQPLLLTAQKIDSLQNLLRPELVDTTQVKLLLALSEAYVDNDMEKLLLYASQARSKSKRIDYELGLADANRLMGVAQFRTNNLDSASVLFNEAYELFKQLNKLKSAAKVFYSIGLISFRKAEYKEAIAHFEQLIRITEQIQDDNGKSKAYLLLGIIYNDQGNPVKAIDFYQKSLEIEERLGNKSIQSMLHNNMSTLFFEQGEDEKSLEYLKKSLSLIDQSKSTVHRSNLVGNMGQIKSKLGFHQDALNDFRNSHKILLDVKEICHQSNTLNRIGGCFISLKQHDSAMFYLKKSLAIARQCNDKGQLAKTMINLGIYTYETGQIEDARIWLQEGFTIANEFGLLFEKKSASQNLYQIFKDKENYALATKFLEEYHTAKDTIISEKNTKQITRLQAEFEFEKEKTALILAQEKQELLIQNELKEERFIKYVSFIVLFFTGLLAYILYRYYRSKIHDNKQLTKQNEIIIKQSNELRLSSEKENKLLNEQIKLKERELAALAMQANEKNNMLTSLNEALNNVNIDPSNQAQIKEIKNMIANNVKESDSWDSFLHKFEDIYPEFFEHLKSEFENLTLNELKLCGYIKIGMNNHEIMRVANVANSTVKKNLNRLKKKLTLGAEDSIRNFLIKYH